MEYHDLNKPLNEKEKKQLSRLETQYEMGEELTPDQGDVLVEFWQRQDRQADLEAFRARYESKYFGEWGGESIELEHFKAFNYLAKLECYKQKRQYRTTAQSLRELIKTEREEQLELKLKAIRSANLKGDPDEMQIKFDFIERVYEDYEQFLKQELEELNQTSAAALALLEPKPLLFPTQEPTSKLPESTAINEEQPSTPKSSLPSSQGDFSIYLNTDYQERLLPFLKEQYTDAKTKLIVCMLFALSDLGALNIKPSEANQTDLHKALQYFGNVGTRQALNTSISNFNSASQKEQLEIAVQRKLINAHLESE